MLTVPCIELSGDGYTRGLKHGSNLRTLIHQNVKNWKSYIERRHGISASVFITTFLRQTNYVFAAEKYCPDLLEEVKGIAEGAKLDFDTCLPEEWVFEAKAEELAERDGHCSVVGVRVSERKTILSQNMDINRFYDGGQTILHVVGSEVSSYVLTIAGFLGLCGMNNKGLAQCCNTISQISTSKTGVPVTFLVRSILLCKTVPEAMSLLNLVPHASGMTYTVASPTQWVSLECSAKKVVDSVEPHSKTLSHTNHPLKSDDLIRPDPYVSLSSLKRLDYLVEKLSSVKVEEVNEITVQSWLSHHPVCINEDHNTGFTFGSVVMVLTETEPVFYISPGPPSVTEWSRLPFL